MKCTEEIKIEFEPFYEDECIEFNPNEFVKKEKKYSSSDYSSTSTFDAASDEYQTEPITKKPKRSYQCDLCNVEFQRSYELKRHQFVGIHTLTVEPNNGFGADIDNDGDQGAADNDDDDDDNVDRTNNKTDGNIIFEIIELPDKSNNSQQSSSSSFTSNTQHLLQPTNENIQNALSIQLLDQKFEIDCDLCGDVFYNIKTFDEHLLRHNQTNDYQRCQLCDETFNCLEILRNHIIGHVSNRPYKCTICEMSFSSLFRLGNHTKIHFNKNNQKFFCKLCNEEYLYHDLFAAHLYLHTDIKPFKCEQCDWSFIHRISLQRHIQVIHSSSTQ